MNTKKSLRAALISVMAIACLTGAVVMATNAQNSSASDPSIPAKLDEIISANREILDSLNGIKEELRIIKIRVSQGQ
jgi:hypothetical protein